MTFDELLAQEWDRITASRRDRGDLRQSAKLGDLVGLALSSGGNRSLQFSVGVLEGLADTGLLRAIDYVSSVEGGGFAAGWFTTRIADGESAPAEPKLPPPPSATTWLYVRNVAMHFLAASFLLFGLAGGLLTYMSWPKNSTKDRTSDVGFSILLFGLGISVLILARRKKFTPFSYRQDFIAREYLQGHPRLEDLGKTGPYPLFGTASLLTRRPYLHSPLAWGSRDDYHVTYEPVARVLATSSAEPVPPVQTFFRKVFNLLDDDYGAWATGTIFDQLGLYELVRRKCRFIIVSDATDDPDSHFDAFGDIIRKCRQDLGAEIDISLSPLSPSDGISARHYQMGAIRYQTGETATLLYIHPTITSDEPTDLFQYARSHPDFPRSPSGTPIPDPTQEQSYRSLGRHIIESLSEEVGFSNWRVMPVPQILREIRRKLRPDLEDFGDTRPSAEIPKQLADAIAARRCVLCGGVGLAAEAGLPTWSDLFEGILRQAREKSLFDPSSAKELSSAITRGHLDEAGDELSHRIPSDQMETFISSLFKNAKPGRAFELLGTMSFLGVLNTSLDSLLAGAFQQEALMPNQASRMVDALQNQTMFAANINGSPVAPLLSTKQFRNMLGANRPFRQFLETLFFKYHTLFVGMSLDGVRGLFDSLDLARRPELTQYVLISNEGAIDPVKVRYLERTYNVHIIGFQPGYNYSGLEEILEQLRLAVSRNSSSVQPAGGVPVLRSVTLENIGPFESFRLDLTPGWNMIVGDNGTGKTVVLRAIAAALCGEYADKDAVKRLLRSGTEKGIVRLMVDNREYKVELERDRDGNVQIASSTLSPLQSEKWLAIGVPSLRSVPWENPDSPQDIDAKGPVAEDLLPLLRGVPDGRVANLKQWIINLDYKDLKPVINQFFEVLRGLTKGLTLELAEISRDPIEIRVKTDGGIVPLSAVSQGTGSVMCWIGTLLERLHEAGLSQDDRALVLVDEIDAHMHPKWQQAFVQAFSALFKSVQVIATTHSPLLIGSLKKEEIWHVRKGPVKSRIDGIARVKPVKDGFEIIVTGPEPDPDEESAKEREIQTVRIRAGLQLRVRDGELVQAGEALTTDDTEIGAERIAIPPEGWRADQILTLPYFGLETTRDAKTASMINDFTTLLTSGDPQNEKIKRLAAQLAIRAPAPHESVEAREAFQMINDFYAEKLKSLDPDNRERILREVQAQLTESITGSRRPL
jgi:hypothetical protein